MAGMAILVISVCGFATSFVGQRVETRTEALKIEYWVAEAQKRGLPFDAKELQDNTVPKFENAFETVTKLIRDLGHEGRIDEAIISFRPTKGKTIPPRLQSYLDAAKEVSKFKTFDARTDYDLGLFYSCPEHNFYDEMVKALALDAQQQALDGKVDAAIADLSEARKLEIQLNHSSELTGGLVIISLDLLLSLTSLQIAEICSEHPVDLRKLRNFLAADTPIPDFLKCIRSEFFAGVTTARNFNQFGGLAGINGKSSPNLNPSTLVRSGLPSDVENRNLLAAFIEHSVTIYDYFKSGKNLTEAGKLANTYRDAIPYSASNGIALRLIPPHYALDGSLWDQVKIGQEIDRWCVEILLQKSSSGFPQNVKPRRDPVMGGDLVYMRTDKGFKIFSIGANGVNDGGPGLDSDGRKNDDIGIEFPFKFSTIRSGRTGP